MLYEVTEIVEKFKKENEELKKENEKLKNEIAKLYYYILKRRFLGGDEKWNNL